MYVKINIFEREHKIKILEVRWLTDGECWLGTITFINFAVTFLSKRFN